MDVQRIANAVDSYLYCIARKRVDYPAGGADGNLLTNNAEDGKSDDEPCWKNYEMVGMKPGKGGKPVPNCVPKNKKSKKKPNK